MCFKCLVYKGTLVLKASGSPLFGFKPVIFVLTAQIPKQKHATIILPCCVYRNIQ